MPRKTSSRRDQRAKAAKQKAERKQASRNRKLAVDVAKGMAELQLDGEKGAKEAGEILAQLQLLTQGHNQLVQAHTRNFEAFKGAIAHLDAYVAIFQKILDDMLAGDVTTKERDVAVFTAEGEKEIVQRTVIDWDSYISYFKENGEDRLGFLYGIPSEKEEESEEEEPVAAPVEQEYGEGAVEFGG